MAPLGHAESAKRYGTYRPIKRQLTVYGTSRPRGINKNAKTFRKQKQKQKRKWKSKNKKKIENENKNKNENKNENESKNENENENENEK